MNHSDDNRIESLMPGLWFFVRGITCALQLMQTKMQKRCKYLLKIKMTGLFRSWSCGCGLLRRLNSITIHTHRPTAIEPKAEVIKLFFVLFAIKRVHVKLMIITINNRRNKPTTLITFLFSSFSAISSFSSRAHPTAIYSNKHFIKSFMICLCLCGWDRDKPFSTIKSLLNVRHHCPACAQL